MQPKFSIGEINVICTDIEESLYFYRDILGFSVVEQEDETWHLACGKQSVLLLPVAGKQELSNPRSGRDRMGGDRSRPIESNACGLARFQAGPKLCRLLMRSCAVSTATAASRQ